MCGYRVDLVCFCGCLWWVCLWDCMELMLGFKGGFVGF